MSEPITLKNNSCIYKIYNTKVREYITGLVKIKRTSFDIVKGRVVNNKHNGKSTDEQLNKYLKKRVKERKEKIIDLAFNNSWEYFITLTFDSCNLNYFPNGYSHEVAISLMVKWLNNLRHKNKNMRYIIVCEFHKESKHLHFHGLFSNVDFDLSQSINPHNLKPIIINGVNIYNINNYSLGFSTLSYIKDSSKVSIYLSKYITKELITLRNKKVFWYSRNLIKPITHYKYESKSLKTSLTDLELKYFNEFEKNNSIIELAEYQKE